MLVSRLREGMGECLASERPIHDARGWEGVGTKPCPLGRCQPGRWRARGDAAGGAPRPPVNVLEVVLRGNPEGVQHGTEVHRLNGGDHLLHHVHQEVRSALLYDPSEERDRPEVP